MQRNETKAVARRQESQSPQNARILRMSHYDVRVQQAEGELAWGSPFWSDSTR